MDDVTEAYDHFYDHAKWELKFAILPHKCDRTGEIIWLEYGYQGVRVWGATNDDPVYEKRWLTRDVWIIEKIKGRI